MHYEFDWGLPFRQPHLTYLAVGLMYTALLTVVSTAGSLVLGIAVSIGRLSDSPPLRIAALTFVEIFRGIPTVFWILFFYFAAPDLGGKALAATLNHWAGLPLAAALAGLTASNAAHVAEIMRSCFQALPHTQAAAASSLGLHPVRIWLKVLCPQALRLSLPALGPRMVHNFHNTSLALVIAVPELTWQTRQIETETFRGFEALTVASLLFIALSLLMTIGFRMLERRSARWS